MITDKPKYYLIDADALPEVFVKVLEAKELLETGAVRTVGEAAERVCLSRSAFYKYKDAIQPMRSFKRDAIVTFQITLRDRPGALSSLLSIFPESGANILTINQSIPTSGTALVTISIATEGMDIRIDDLMDSIRRCEGVIKAEILAG